MIGVNESIRFTIHQSLLCGDEVANVGVIRITCAGGSAVEVDGVYTYRRSPSGKIASLRAYWEPDARSAPSRSRSPARSVGHSQPVNPYCWWGPITAHSNIP